MNAPPISPEDRRRLRLYLRLVLSYKDFKHAKRCGQYLLAEHVALAEQSGDDLKLRALYCSMVISCARPFNSAGTSRLGRVPPLGDEFRSTLPEADAAFHDYVLWCRNKLIGHTDAEAVDPLPYFATDLPGDMVIPETNDALAPFTPEASEAALRLATAAFNWAVLERRTLELQVLHLLERRPFNPGDRPHHVGT